MSRWFMLAVVLVACGGGASEEPAVSAPIASAPGNLSSFTFVVRSGLSADPTTSALQGKLEGVLVNAGYKVADPSAAHDIDLIVTTQSQFEPSAFQFVINGQPSGNNHVAVQVSVMSGRSVIDRLSAEYRARVGQVDDAAVNGLVAALGRSRGLAQLAREQTERDEAAAAAQQRAEDANKQEDDRRARGQEDGEWYAIRLEQCRVPASLNACDAVRAFLARRPDGAHAQEAKEALKVAQPKLDALQKDEATWTAANPEACRRGDKDACTHVEIYLAKYPAGLHAAEARQLVGVNP